MCTSFLIQIFLNTSNTELIMLCCYYYGEYNAICILVIWIANMKHAYICCLSVSIFKLPNVQYVNHKDKLSYERYLLFCFFSAAKVAMLEVKSLTLLLKFDRIELIGCSTYIGGTELLSSWYHCLMRSSSAGIVLMTSHNRLNSLSGTNVGIGRYPYF